VLSVTRNVIGDLKHLTGGYIEAEGSFCNRLITKVIQQRRSGCQGSACLQCGKAALETKQGFDSQCTKRVSYFRAAFELAA
jgi:hypothetical protein